MSSRYRLHTAVAVSVVALGWVGCGDDETSTSSTTGDTTTTTTTTATTTTTTTGVGGEGGGAGGAGGAGGEGGGTPISDQCPGTAIDLDLGETETVNGSTSDATDDYSSYCGDTTAEEDAADVAFVINVAEGGSLTLTAQNSAGLDVAMVVQSVCGVDNAGDICLDLSAGAEILRSHFPAGAYSVILDGSGGTSGDFTLTAALAAAACQDGILNPDEDCDDGNAATGDGCAPDCTFEQPDLKDTCPGEAVLVPLGDSLVGPHFTTGYNDDYAGSCSDSAAPDAVYAVTPAVTGTLTVTVGNDENGASYCVDRMNAGCWDRAVYARSGDCASGAELACADDPNDFAVVETISFPVTAATTYYVFVDGFLPESSGPFYLQLNLQ